MALARATCFTPVAEVGLFVRVLCHTLSHFVNSARRSPPARSISSSKSPLGMPRRLGSLESSQRVRDRRAKALTMCPSFSRSSADADARQDADDAGECGFENYCRQPSALCWTILAITIIQNFLRVLRVLRPMSAFSFSLYCNYLRGQHCSQSLTRFLSPSSVVSHSSLSY